MVCRACGYVLRVPTVPVSEPPDGELAQLQAGRWYLQFASGRKFGPVLPDVIADWVREGRADAESLVCPDGRDEWYHLEEAFPDLIVKHTTEPADPYTATPGGLMKLPAKGLLKHFPNDLAELSAKQRKRWDALDAAVNAEADRSMGAVRFVHSICTTLPSGITMVNGDGPRQRNLIRASHTYVAEFSAAGSPFYLAVPWGSAGRMAHEFFSILPAKVPHSAALRRRHEGGFDGGEWIGINGLEDDVVAVAARRVSDQLADGINWEWQDEEQDYQMTIVWGVQAMPLGEERCLHLLQTTARKEVGKEFGLLWYMQRQSSFYRFARRLHVPDTHEPTLLFSCATGQLLTLALGQAAGWQREAKEE